jgi:hypothetical protein
MLIRTNDIKRDTTIPGQSVIVHIALDDSDHGRVDEQSQKTPFPTSGVH